MKPEERKNYEAVFVDWHGTLSESLLWGGWQNHPRYGGRYEKIQRALFAATGDEALLVQQWMTGFKEYPEVLEYTASRTGIFRSVLESELQRSAENMAIIDEDQVLKSVRRLREAGKHVVIATDNMDVFDKWTVPSLDLRSHFDDVLNSSAIGKLKSTITTPDAGVLPFFADYMESEGFDPEAGVLIDDMRDAETIRRIENMGIDVLHVTSAWPLSRHLDVLLGDIA